MSLPAHFEQRGLSWFRIFTENGSSLPAPRAASLMNINFMGVLYVTHAFLEDMIKKGGGQIVKGIKHRKRRVIESWINWMTYLLKRPAPLSFDIGGDVAARALCERRKEAR